jgi:hypothetical protein
MVKRLSQVQQRAMLNAMPETRKIAVKKYCRTCQQKGDGITDILKKIGDFLGPLAKDVGPKVLKEFIIPLLLKKAKEHYGVGLSPAGKGLPSAGNGLSPAGGSLKLAGQGKKTSPWILHVKKTAKDNNISYKDAMKIASKTYKTKS